MTNNYVDPERLHSFLARLISLDPKAQKDAFASEVIETGGTYIAPPKNGGSTHMFEIALHGITAYGACEQEAIRNWHRCAQSGPFRTSFKAANLPFPKPRNHAEEIANARADFEVGKS